MNTGIMVSNGKIMNSDEWCNKYLDSFKGGIKLYLAKKYNDQNPELLNKALDLIAGVGGVVAKKSIELSLIPKEVLIAYLKSIQSNIK